MFLLLLGVAIYGCVSVKETSTCFNVSHPAVSPDGTRMLFVSDRFGSADIYVADIHTKQINRLTYSGGQDSRPSWSPDGYLIVFDSDRFGNTDIFLMKSDGTELRRLTDDPALDMFAKISPDAAHIVFHSDREENREIFTMDINGASQENITEHPSRDGVASWSSDGKQILFHSTRTGSFHFQLYIMQTDGEKQTRITFTVVPEEHALFSPDGRHIAYYREHPQRTRNAEIYVMDSHNGATQDIVSHDAFLSIGEYAPPVWFPDSVKIAFWATEHDAICSSIYTVDRNGAELKKFEVNWSTIIG